MENNICKMKKFLKNMWDVIKISITSLYLTLVVFLTICLCIIPALPILSLVLLFVFIAFLCCLPILLCCIPSILKQTKDVKNDK